VLKNARQVIISAGYGEYRGQEQNASGEKCSDSTNKRNLEFLIQGEKNIDVLGDKLEGRFGARGDEACSDLQKTLRA